MGLLAKWKSDKTDTQEEQKLKFSILKENLIFITFRPINPSSWGRQGAPRPGKRSHPKGQTSGRI